MKRRTLPALALLLCFPLIAHALSFDDLAQRTRSPDLLLGHFHQTKYLSALETSIESSGDFSYRREREIRWTTLTPVADELVMTPQGMDSGTTGQPGLSASDNPTIALIGKIFFAVMSADWSVLEQHFTLSGELQEQDWHATLVPLDEEIGFAIQRIDLIGDDYLRQLELTETGGDRVLIEFSDLTP